jgi:TusA-related sulfurtransferase
MPSGAILEVWCDDVVSACDVEVWATHHGYRVMTWETQDLALRLTIGHQPSAPDLNNPIRATERR